ncbi:Sodium/hydrogen exchanger 8 [Irineochytrium annulatum]|nr:Sodium/hydrogen exchanger 8 [Irineochytrium annulatum]
MGEFTTVGETASATEATHALFIRALLLLSMVLISMNINGFLHRMKFHYLSETAVTILLGVVVAMGWTAMSYDEHNHDIQLSSDFFYMVLLPPIIFEGGFTLQRVTFFGNIVTIVSLAFAGALYSTFICSTMMFFFSKLIFPWSLAESLVFGSLISSTDPVTVLSLLPSNVDKRLYMLIFGESALNDAVAIILFRFFTEIADPKMKVGVGPFFISVFASAGVFIGSFMVGCAMALIFAYITKHVKMPDSHVYEMTMLLIFAYSSYLLADVLQLTGIISIFFCGITMAQYAAGNLSEEARRTIRVTLRVIAFMCECFIFLYLGLGLLSFGGKTVYDPLMIVFAVISILVSRTHVFIIFGIRNMILKKEEPVPLNQQTLIWFSGLRGAVAFALGVSFLEIPVFDPDVKGIIFGTTVMVVVITVIIFGGLTPYMLVWLKIVAPHSEGEGHEAVDDGEHHGAGEVDADGKQVIKVRTEGKDGEKHSEDYNMVEGDEEEGQHEAESKPVFNWLYQLDAKYIRPHFTNNHRVDTFTPKRLFPPVEPIALEDSSDVPSSSRKQSVASRKQTSALDMEALVKKSSTFTIPKESSSYVARTALDEKIEEQTAQDH